jgi:hypothetical protein
MFSFLNKFNGFRVKKAFLEPPVYQLRPEGEGFLNPLF